VRKSGGSGTVSVEVSGVGSSTPRKRSSNAAMIHEGGPSAKRERSPEPLPPPTPLSEPQQSAAAVQETTNDSGTLPQSSELLIGNIETPNFLAQWDRVISQFPRPSIQTDVMFIAPPYSPEVLRVQEPYVARNVNEANLAAPDPTARPLYDSLLVNDGQWPVFPIAPSILPIESTSTAMVHISSVDLGVPFQYQESSERLHHHRQSDTSQFDFARNLQQSIPPEPSQTNTLNLLAGVVQHISEQQAVFPGLPIDQQIIEQPIEEQVLDLNEIIENLFLGS